MKRRRRRDVIRLLTARGRRVEVSVCAFCAALVLADGIGQHWRTHRAVLRDPDGGLRWP